MGRRASNPNEFQSVEYAIVDAAKEQSVPNEQIWEQYSELTKLGTIELATTDNKARVARIMKKTIMKLADVVVEPPFSDTQQAVIDASYETWSTLTESISEPSSEKPVRKKQVRPTPTDKIKTRDSKY